jgi:flagellar motor switch/type III secretory pathway protein FliN
MDDDDDANRMVDNNVDRMVDNNADRMVDNTVENKSFENAASENKPDVGLDVPIDINVQLGTLVVNKDNAMSMEQGDILKFETSCPGEVSLVFQGREIGRGKLVDIEGYLGVQITHNWCRS